MLVFIAAVLWVSNNRFNDPLNKYQEAYGYSLKDIDVHYIDRLYISNFQDPQEEYVVSVEGNIEGTLFDLNGHTYTQYLESDGLTMNLKGRRIYTDALARLIKYHLGFIGEEEANKTITIADYN